MSSSTEKLTPIGRAIARVRDRYRDTELLNEHITDWEYELIKEVLNEVKSEYWTVVEEEEETAWAALERDLLAASEDFSRVS